MTTVIVLAGGEAPHPGLALPGADLVIAADSGADRAAALGLTVDVLVGDLDSVEPGTVAEVEARGGEVARHPRNKDATDLDLALSLTIERGATRIVLVGGHGGRLDHSLATFGVLAAAASSARDVEAWMGPAHLHVVVDRVDLAPRVGEIVSLVPLVAPVTGITTSGLRWPLAEARFDVGSTWGVSNEATSPRAAVSVTSGVLAVIRPHALSPEHDDPHHVPT